MTVRNQIDSKYTRIMTENIVAAYRRALVQIYKLPADEITNIDQIIDIINKEYEQSAVVNSDQLYNMSKAQYTTAIRQVTTQIRQSMQDFKYNYNRIDTDVLNVLDRNNSLFVGKYFTEQAEPGIRKELEKIITEQQTKKETAEAIRQMMVDKGKESYGYSKMLVETNGTWARSIGKTSALEDAGFTEYAYQVTVDDVTSEICLALDGKTNQVENAQSTRDQYLNIDTSNYDRAKSQLESFSPFIRETENGFEAAGRSYGKDQLFQIPGIALPPFHPNCRTEIIAVK